MAKLKTIRPLLGKLPPLVGRAPGETARDRQRAAKQPWRAWYNSPRWTALRDRIRVRDMFTCGMCRRACSGKGQSAVDHRIPHHGDPRMFWDDDNLWLLCKPCHDGAKQREEKGAGR